MNIEEMEQGLARITDYLDKRREHYPETADTALGLQVLHCTLLLHLYKKLDAIERLLCERSAS